MNRVNVFINVFLLCVLPSVLNSNSWAQTDQTFANPILSGFYPDPSICKVGSDYYLTTSTFSYFPGLPVFQSKDLVNWKLIGYVLDRSEQLNLDGQGVSRGLFAPSIRYSNGLFYVTCTLADIGGNFVTISNSPAGPWSNPVWLSKINGIDPSLFFDDNGKSYIIYNSVAPKNQPLYEGHRTIRMYEFNAESLKVVGIEHMIINGGTDLNKHPVWIEAPHIFKVNDYYYLIAAEGGTSDQHSEVVFRSINVLGPYIPYRKNPILTQRNLNPEREFPITSTGHADFVRLDNGDWWAVFLGIRPYSMEHGEFCNTGRETFLAPVKWINEWPVINPDYKEVQYFYPYPLPPRKDFAVRQYGGNFTLRDDFDNRTLDKNWMFLRTPHEKWYNLTEKKGFISVKLRAETCSGGSNPSFLGFRQQHLTCSAVASLIFDPATENEKAGLLIFLNENHFYYMCKSLTVKGQVVQLYKSGKIENSENKMELLTSSRINKENTKKDLKLKIEAAGKYYSFFYKFENEEWKLLQANVDAEYLSAVIPRDFVGCMFALYATSLGKESSNKCYFDSFEYEGNDIVYNDR